MDSKVKLFVERAENEFRLAKAVFNLSKLKEKGILKRVGADKGGYWEILR